MPSGSTQERERPKLDRDRVVHAAIDLADEAGLDALSMRTLAERVGVKAMSLYNHVDHKDDLLDAMVDVVYGEIDLAAEPDWKTAMRDRAVSARQVLAQHPWAIPLMESRTVPGPANLHHHDTVLGILHAAGFPIQAATFAYAVLDSYLYGFALQEASLPFGTPEELAATSEAIVRSMPADGYLHMRAAAIELSASGFSFADQFEAGLDLVLDGLERYLAT